MQIRWGRSALRREEKKKVMKCFGCKIKSMISISNKNLFPESMFAMQLEMFG
jgi:hypothetical protein